MNHCNFDVGYLQKRFEFLQLKRLDRWGRHTTKPLVRKEVRRRWLVIVNIILLTLCVVVRPYNLLSVRTQACIILLELKGLVVGYQIDLPFTQLLSRVLRSSTKRKNINSSAARSMIDMLLRLLKG